MKKTILNILTTILFMIFIACYSVSVFLISTVVFIFMNKDSYDKHNPDGVFIEVMFAIIIMMLLFGGLIKYAFG